MIKSQKAGNIVHPLFILSLQKRHVPGTGTFYFLLSPGRHCNERPAVFRLFGLCGKRLEYLIDARLSKMLRRQPCSTAFDERLYVQDVFHEGTLGLVKNAFPYQSSILDPH